MNNMFDDKQKELKQQTFRHIKMTFYSESRAQYILRKLKERVIDFGAATVWDLFTIADTQPNNKCLSETMKNWGWKGNSLRYTEKYFDTKDYTYTLIFPPTEEMFWAKHDHFNKGENDMTITSPSNAIITDANMINVTGVTTGTCTSNLSTAATVVSVGVPSLYNKITDEFATYDCRCVTETKKKPKKSEPPKIILPKVEKVETYNGRVVKVTFADGTFTKSVCAENDIFDLDVGITICLFKRALGSNGHRWYNDLMRKVHKTMDKNEEEKRKKKEEDEKKRMKQRKETMAKAAKKLKEKEEAIDIQAQGVERALRNMGLNSINRVGMEEFE